MATRKYVVTADRHRHILTKDGKVVGSKRYFKGDVIELDEGDAERLVRAGGLTSESEYDEPEGTDETLDQTVAAASGSTVPQGPVSTGEVQDDGYEDMDYSDLQSLAKDRDLSAGGSRDDLVARLREYDQEQATTSTADDSDE